MSASFTLRPGVFFEWIDQGISPTAVSTSIGAMVFPADRGSLNPQSVTGYDRFRERYGNADFTRGYGHDTAKAFFRTAEVGYALRVTGTGAKYAASQVANNYIIGATSSANPQGLVSDGSTTLAIPTGSDVDVSLINRDSVDIIFSNANLADNMSFDVSINGTAITQVPFTGDSHTNTMHAIAQSIRTVLDNISPGGLVSVVNRVNGSGNPRTIRIISPHNINLTVTGAAFSGSAAGAAPTILTRDTEWLHYTVTENPGDWGNNIATQFDGIDVGRAAKRTLTFSGPMASNHRFSYLINGYSAVVAANAGGSNAMLDDIAASINSTVPDVIATVGVVSGTNLNRVITIQGKNSNVDLDIVSYTPGFASGSTPALPSVTMLKIVDRLLPSADFSFSVYEYPNLRVPVESYRGSYRQSLDASGNQINLEYLVNQGPNRSSRIRIYSNPQAVTNGWTIKSQTGVDYYTGEGFLRGGVNGTLPTSADIIQGWNQFKDTTRYDIRILMDCGYSTPEVHRNMTVLCETRRDCTGIIGVPSSFQNSTDSILSYRNETVAIDSSYMAIYDSDVEIYDEDAGIYRYSPPSGYVGAVYAFTDRTRREFWSPAGLRRGRIPEANNVRVRHEDGDMSLMAGAQVNPIINYKGQGVYVFGDSTMQYANSPLQFIGTRRMCNAIELIAAKTVVYSLFEPNTKAGRREVVVVGEAILQDYLDAGGIERFKVSDKTTDGDVDQRKARFDWVIDPTTSIHQIYITGVLTRQGDAQFEEAIRLRSQGNGIS